MKIPAPTNQQLFFLFLWAIWSVIIKDRVSPNPLIFIGFGFLVAVVSAVIIRLLR